MSKFTNKFVVEIKIKHFQKILFTHSVPILGDSFK